MPSPLDGPRPPLPRPLDAAADRWVRMPPRLRVLLVAVLLLLVGAGQAARLADAQARWGGPGETVWRATATVPAGRDPTGSLTRAELPAAALPADPVVGGLPDDPVLALPLVEGAVLSRAHLDPRGPAAALGPDERLVPIPVEATWGIEAGGVVDVWAVVGDVVAPEPLATARPVAALRDDGGRPVALVVLDAADVGPATAALSRGRVLLALRGG